MASLLEISSDFEKVEIVELNSYVFFFFLSTPRGRSLGVISLIGVSINNIVYCINNK